MGWLQALVAFALVALAFVAWRWVRFTANWKDWRYFLGAEHQDKRDALDRCRAELRKAESARERRQDDAESELRRAQRDYKRDVREAERKLRSLRQTKAGAQVAILGRVALHEHVLRVYHAEGVLDENGQRAPASGSRTNYPLDELTIECFPASTAPEIHLTIEPHNERGELVHYAASEYPERQVKEFAMGLNYAVNQAQAARPQTELDIAQAEEELDAAREATEAVDQARARYKDVVAEEASNPTIPRARTALEDGGEVWKGHTGKRPLLL